MKGLGFATASVVKGPPAPPITMVFPCYAGPALRDLATVLLYREKIYVSIPSLFDEKQYLVFREVGDHAHTKQKSCIDAFGVADYHFRLALEQAAAERSALAPLGDHLEFMQIVNNGSPDWYDKALEAVNSQRFGVIKDALNDIQQLNIAGREFIWRVFSAHLEFDGDCDLVVAHLEKHLRLRGSVDGLLAESLLNRYMLLGDGASSRMAIATADARSASILAELAKDTTSPSLSAESRADLLAFMFFDELLRQNIGALVVPNIERVANLFNDRKRELRAMRDRCQREARQMIAEVPTPNMLVRRATETLEAFREEVGALLSLNRTAFRRTVRALTENGAFWTSLAALLGTTLGELGSALPAALGAGVIGQIAAAAAKARNEGRDRLRDSPWSLVYYAHRTRRN